MKTSVNRRPDKKRANILIVDDHPITRHGLRQLLGQEPDLQVCADVDNAQTALLSVAKVKPDLVLADITMGSKSGLELLKEMQAFHPEIPVLVLSMHDENVYAERVLRAGGRGYLMKSAGGEELLKAVRHVLKGDVYVSREMSARLLDMFSGTRTGAGPGHSWQPDRTGIRRVPTFGSGVVGTRNRQKAAHQFENRGHPPSAHQRKIGVAVHA